MIARTERRQKDRAEMQSVNVRSPQARTTEASKIANEGAVLANSCRPRRPIQHHRCHNIDCSLSPTPILIPVSGDLSIIRRVVADALRVVLRE